MTQEFSSDGRDAVDRVIEERRDVRAFRTGAIPEPV
jgi:hypothetical protein